MAKDLGREEGDARCRSAARSTRRSWRRPATGCARRSPRPSSATRSSPSSPTSTPSPTPTPTTGPACWRRSSAARCAGARRCYALADDGRHDLRRARPRHGADRHGQAHRRRQAAPLSVATPDDLDRLLERARRPTPATRARHARRRAPLRHRAAGREPGAPACSPRRRRRRRHRASSRGDLLGQVGDVEVRSPFAGTVMGVLRRRAASGSSVSQPIAWLRTALTGTITTGSHRLGRITGSARPEKIVTNADLERWLDTTDEWIVERTGIHERRIGGTHRRARRRGGAAALDRGRRRRRRHRPADPRDHHPRPAVPATAAAGAARARIARRRVRHQRRLLGLRLRARRTPHGMLGLVGVRARPAHRRRDAVAASPTGTTAAPPSSSPTAPARSCSRPSTGRASCSAGTSAPTARAEPSPVRRPSAATSRWRAARSSAGPCGRWSTRRSGRMEQAGRDCRRRRPRRPPPGQHPHHRGRLPAARHPASSRRPSCSHRTGNTSAASIPLALADAHRAAAASTTATWCCWSASAPA